MQPRRLAGLPAVAGGAVLLTLLTAGSGWRYVWWAVAPGMAVVAVALGVRRHRPARRGPWVVLGGALTLVWIGWTLSASMGAGIGGPTAAVVVPLVRNALYVVAYPAIGVASLLFVRVRTGGRDPDGAIDALVVMMAVATALGTWLFGTEPARGLPDLDRLWVTTSPLVLAAVVSTSMRMLFTGGTRLPAAWLLWVSSVLALFGNLWTSQLIRDGSPTDVTGIDVLWVVAFTTAGAAALHPSMRSLTEPLPAQRLVDGMPIDRLLVFGGALLAVPLTSLRLTDGSAEALAVAVGGVLLAVLVMWRVVRLLRERDVARSAVDEAAARQASIAKLSRWALDDRSTARLLADAEDLLADVLPDLTCRILSVAPMPVAALPVAAPGERRLVIDDGPRRVAEVLVRAPAGRSIPAGEDDFLQAAAAVLSAGIRRRSAEERLRHDAMHDPLTGLPNRTLAMQRLRGLLRRPDRAPVSVVFIDLDGFKLVNDTHGHHVGDRVLADIADRLQRAVPAEHMLARLAGDEFVVITTNTQPDRLDAFVDRLRWAVGAEIDHHGRSIRVSASIGVATATSGTVNAEALLRRADTAMYRVKNDRKAARAVGGRPAGGGGAATPLMVHPLG